MSEAHEYREYAAECLRLAELEPKDGERWLKMAAQWTALAVRLPRSKTLSADPV